MLISQIERIKEKDVAKFAWNGLSYYTNKETNKKSIISLHNPPQSATKNITKQAEQIRQAIILANEYYETSKYATLATKPVLLYYSCMSLALAEILLKQDGNSSLDRARGQHAHHGLEFATTLRKEGSFIEAAEKLRAKPMKVGDNYRGTFELWRRTARHLPLVGSESINYQGGGRTTGIAPLLVSPDEPLEQLDDAGFTLLDCFGRLPFMARTLSLNGFLAPFVRANFTQTKEKAKLLERSLRTIIHPSSPKSLLDLEKHFVIHPCYVNYMKFTDVESGYLFDVLFCEENRKDVFHFPNGININIEEVFLCSKSMRLNEFGNIYVSLFILSNIARYYPDIWIYHIENHTPLSLVISDFLRKASERMAILSLSELSRTYYVE